MGESEPSLSTASLWKELLDCDFSLSIRINYHPRTKKMSNSCWKKWKTLNRKSFQTFFYIFPASSFALPSTAHSRKKVAGTSIFKSNNLSNLSLNLLNIFFLLPVFILLSIRFGIIDTEFYEFYYCREIRLFVHDALPWQRFQVYSEKLDFYLTFMKLVKIVKGRILLWENGGILAAWLHGAYAFSSFCFWWKFTWESDDKIDEERFDTNAM